MASIAKRPNGKWRARYRDAAGREHARHFERKVDAQRWLDEVTASLRAVSLDQLNAYVAEHPVPEPTIVTLGPAAVASEVVA